MEPIDERESERERRTSNARLPAGLEDSGRDEALTHGEDAHPSGMRADTRHSVPGTLIPGGSRPAADEDEFPADEPRD